MLKAWTVSSSHRRPGRSTGSSPTCGARRPALPRGAAMRPVCGVVWAYARRRADARPPWHRCSTASPSRCSTVSGPCRTPQCRARSTRSTRQGHQWYWRADFVNEIPDEAIAIHQRFGPSSPPPVARCTSTPSTARPTTSAPADTPWGYRDANWGRYSRVSSPTPPTPSRSEVALDYFEALHPYSAGGAYVNMMMDEGEDRVRASYRDNYTRLAEDQGALRPGKPVPRQPEHQAGGLGAG